MSGAGAVFFDRDGVLMEEVHYCGDPARVKAYPGAGEALRRIRTAGFRTFIVTNQSGIGRGLITEAQYRAVAGRAAAANRARLDRWRLLLRRSSRGPLPQAQARAGHAAGSGGGPRPGSFAFVFRGRQKLRYRVRPPRRDANHSGTHRIWRATELRTRLYRARPGGRRGYRIGTENLIRMAVRSRWDRPSFFVDC